MLRAVIPAKAGIQCRAYAMDSRLRGNDGAVSAGINKLPLTEKDGLIYPSFGEDSLGGSDGGRRPMRVKRERPRGKGDWRYPEALLREIAAAPGFCTEVAARFGVHRETVARARERFGGAR